MEFKSYGSKYHDVYHNNPYHAQVAVYGVTLISSRRRRAEYYTFLKGIVSDTTLLLFKGATEDFWDYSDAIPSSLIVTGSNRAVERALNAQEKMISVRDLILAEIDEYYKKQEAKKKGEEAEEELDF